VKLAEGLALRADASRRIEQLRTRIVANAGSRKVRSQLKMPGRC